MAVGRYAPSPTGDLHLGNLRTAVLAWLFARSTGSRFVLRMEDLDRVTASREHEASQQRDLAALGVDWDGDVVRQSERFDRYQAAIAHLDAAGLTYPCTCTRREIQEAAAAPHGELGRYPGTCRDLTTAERRAREAQGRPAALRLRSDQQVVTAEDRILGTITGPADDLVLRRNDGVPAYNLAVVVDDADQGVEEVVRADDLAFAAPSQRHLATLLGLPPVGYAHVPLVVGPGGRRLAKRDGAVTLADQHALGRGPVEVLRRIVAGLGLPIVPEALEEAPSVDHLLALALERFDPSRLRRSPVAVAELIDA